MTLAAVLDEFRPGRTVFLPGGPGEIVALQAALTAEPDRLRDVHLVCPMIPGMNRFDYAALHPDVRLTTFMLPPVLHPSFDAGRVRLLPIAYSAIARYIAALRPDVAILHLTPPEAGVCSFGIAADFGPIVAGGAARRIGVLNAALPRPSFAPTIDRDALDVVEIEQPIMTAPETSVGDDVTTLARIVADLVPDGAAIQTGIGGAPGAVWRCFAGHRDLRLVSGLVTDGFLAARDAGAMAETGHVAGIAYGSDRLYAALGGTARIEFADVRTTHGAALAAVPKFTAINSAIEIDLFGQANIEWQAGRMVSGVGGAPDFVRIARASPGGQAIVALPATAKRGAVSRIVSRLSAPTVSLSRGDLDVVATEYGAVRLGALSMDERAAALIAIAAPDFREDLSREWAAVRRSAMAAP